MAEIVANLTTIKFCPTWAELTSPQIAEEQLLAMLSGSCYLSSSC